MDKKDKGPSEHKTMPFIQLKVDEDQGIVDHLITVFGVLDHGNDISHPGSFAKTLTERGGKVKVLDRHQTDSIMRVIGKPASIKEIGHDELPQAVLDRWPEATGGVRAKTQFLIDTPEGAGAFARIKSGAVDEFSYGFDALDFDESTESKDGEEVLARNLRQVRLWEYSPVIWGMNPATVTMSAKTQDDGGEDKDGDEDKVASGATGLPLANRNRAWDAGAARKRIKSWAGAEDGPNAKYGRAFFSKGGDGKEFGDYKLPFADVIDGTFTAIPRAVFAVAGVLSGARGGADIDNVDAVKRKVSAYYARMRAEFDDDDIVVPWKKVDDAPSEEKPVEETENYIRVRVKDPGSFQDDSFRTITISQDQGIKAVIGRLKGETSTTIQTYLFDKDKWTTETAQAWVKEHEKAEAEERDKAQLLEIQLQVLELERLK